MNPVVHFELPYDDRERMVRFYESVFGWRTKSMGGEMGDYVLATTTETDDNGPTTPGAINGGLFGRSDDSPVNQTSLVLEVGDIGEAMRNVRDAGGDVIGDPHDIPGVGTYAVFRDTEGNLNGMLQPVARG